MTARYSLTHRTAHTWRILLVEGNARLRSQLGAALAAHDCDVFEAASLAAARHELAVGEFDAIVTAMSLRDGNGLAVVQAARRAGRAAPVLVGSTGVAKAGRASGIWFASERLPAALFDAIHDAVKVAATSLVRALVAPLPRPLAAVTTPMPALYA